MSTIAITAPRIAVRKASRRIKPARVILHAFLIAMVALWLFPLFWAVFASLRPYVLVVGEAQTVRRPGEVAVQDRIAV